MYKFNDLNMDNWKNIKNDITTDALWISKKKKDDGKFIIPKRNFLPKNDSDFHGIFIPEIPYQFIKRFTKKGEVILDPFAGSGTTKRVADILDRNSINIDLNPSKDYIIKGDARKIKIKQKVQLVILHPPYHNIVKYSNNENDGSNQGNIENFLEWFKEVIENINQYLESNRFLILVCGNIYQDGEEHTLGVWCKDIIRDFGYKLKSHIIKDYGETKTKNNRYNLNYYRQLKFGYNNFYGDNVFILRKNK